MTILMLGDRPFGNIRTDVACPRCLADVQEYQTECSGKQGIVQRCASKKCGWIYDSSAPELSTGPAALTRQA